MANKKDSEAKLQKLIEIGTTHNQEGIKDYKSKGGRVVGLLAASGYVPEEVVYAGEMLPWHIVGTMRESTPLAGVHRSPATDGYNNHVLESLLSGELDFLNAIVVTNYDDDTKSMEYFARFYGKPPVALWLEIPVDSAELNLKRYIENIRKMRTDIEMRLGTITRTDIGIEDLRNAIKKYNASRKLLTRIYEWRKRDNPPVAGSEIWGIVSAAMSMPQREFIEQLEPLMPYIEQRESTAKKGQPRILLSSDFLHHPDYIKLIEDGGGIVAMDDLDTGSRYFMGLVDETGDPIQALAKRYLEPLSSPRFVNWDRQIDQIIDWVKEYKIDGVIEMPVLQALPRLFRSEYFARTMEENNIPYLDVHREYHLANVAQITTRVEAFLEMLEQRK